MTILIGLLLLLLLGYILRLYWQCLAREDKWIFGNLLVIKMAAGMLFGAMNRLQNYVSDTWGYHQESLQQFALLKTNPSSFFSGLFGEQQSTDFLNFFESTHSFWHSIKTTLIVKLLTVFNCLSQGNYYINVVIYSILTFAGSLVLYKLFLKIYPSQKNTLIVGCFLLPSFLFWNSGVHKDGLIFTALALLAHGCYSVFHEGGWTGKRFFQIAGSLLLIFLFRNFIFLTLLPALVAWLVAAKTKVKPFRVFFLTYLIFVVLFFSLRYVHPSLDFAQAVARRQQEFLSLKGQSQLPLNWLYSDFRIFLNTVPQALNHSLMRPYLAESNGLFYWICALEILAFEILFILFLLFRKEGNGAKPVIYYCIFFGLSMMLMIGYTIPYIGALVRYRSMFWPFLLVPLVANTDWGKIKALMKREH
jgi:hypothetical protein